MELFWLQGYESTSINDLTSAMRITAPSLYAAFGDKESLYLESVERYRSGLGNSGRILAGEATARAAIERLLEASAIELTNTRDHPPGCMVVASAINGSPESAHLQAALRSCRVEAEARITDKIKRGVRNGELPPQHECRRAEQVLYDGDAGYDDSGQGRCNARGTTRCGQGGNASVA